MIKKLLIISAITFNVRAMNTENDMKTVRDAMKIDKIVVFNKLVRDKIPAIIASRGEKAVTRILEQEEYLPALYAKLQEEMAEFLDNPTAEELADILEVVYALAPLVAGSLAALEKVRADKAHERGAFDKRIFLVEVHK
jgi:predicted house-cleaning noncanonical NTP pyrophosphatase (MazG superfamily)